MILIYQKTSIIFLLLISIFSISKISGASRLSINSDEAFSAITTLRPGESTASHLERMLIIRPFCHHRYQERLGEMISKLKAEQAETKASDAADWLRRVLLDETWRHSPRSRPDTCK